MSKGKKDGGLVRLAVVRELIFVFLLLYVASQVAPAVYLRVQFLNEMDLAANSTHDQEAGDITDHLLEVAEGLNLTIQRDNLQVTRSFDERKTVVVAQYEIHISFWPFSSYVWNVEDISEAHIL